MSTPSSYRVRGWIEDQLTATKRKRSDLAAAMNIAPSALTRALSGDRQISMDELAAAIQFFGNEKSAWRLIREIYPAIDSYLEFLYDRTDVADSEIPAKDVLELALIGDPERQKLEDVIYIANFERGPLNTIQLSSSILRGYEGEDGLSLRWMTVFDDSMSPTLNLGEVIIIDLNRKRLSPAGIFALDDGLDGVSLRRVESAFSTEGNVQISADNERYETITRPAAEVRSIGRCICRIQPGL